MKSKIIPVNRGPVNLDGGGRRVLGAVLVRVPGLHQGPVLRGPPPLQPPRHSRQGTRPHTQEGIYI